MQHARVRIVVDSWWRKSVNNRHPLLLDGNGPEALVLHINISDVWKIGAKNPDNGDSAVVHIHDSDDEDVMVDVKEMVLNRDQVNWNGEMEEAGDT